MSNLTRADIQTKIDSIRSDDPNIEIADLTDQISIYLDGFDLSNEAFDQEVAKQRIMDDLNSYAGIEED